MVKMSTQEAENAISVILERGVGSFVDPDNSFRKKLIAKAMGQYPEEVIVKFGVDPTRPDIHLGHAVILRKLRQMQDIGVKVVFLVGDFTAMIGDPTGKSKVRPQLETQKEENKSNSVGIKNIDLERKSNAPGSEKISFTTTGDKLPSSEEIERNMKTYLEQVNKILDMAPDKFSWIRNADWYIEANDLIFGNDAKASLTITNSTTNESQDIPIDTNSLIGKTILFQNTRMQITNLHKNEITLVTLRGLLWTMKHLTLAQLLERDMFQKRIKDGESLYIHELIYPVLQGIDSFSIAKIYNDCSLEVGGTDQMFNMLMGRKIMEVNNQKPQAVLSFELLVGLDGKEKMSKSLDNYVGITDEPADMFGKLMSIPDTAIKQYFELCTFTQLSNIKNILKEVESGKTHPKEVKMDLAQQIVEIYHGRDAGSSAREGFVKTFQKKEIPEDILSITCKKNIPLVDALLEAKLVASKGEFRRLIEEGAIREGGTIKISETTVIVSKDTVFKIGKHRFVKIVIE